MKQFKKALHMMCKAFFAIVLFCLKVWLRLLLLP